jgi:hypothetical protein
MRTQRFVVIAALVAGCGDSGPDDPPIDPSAAANFRGYAAVQDDLYAKLIAADTPFELYDYLGKNGEELSKLVGRPDGFGVTLDVRNAKPNAMNVIVWRMMLRGLANDLAASCPGSHLTPAMTPKITLNAQATGVVMALCAWPTVDDKALGDAWDLTIGYLAPAKSRAAWIQYAHSSDLQSRRADDALPLLWLGALLHPAFLLEQ